MATRTAGERGLTLIELVVSLAIMSILAAAALPMFEVGVRRERELELRRSLRLMRRAIDEFHLSYVASGGATSQGPVALPGQASATGNGTNVRNRNASAPNNPALNQGANQPGTPGVGTQPEIPLIDVSQFDPIDSKGYPPDLMTLVEGVQASGTAGDESLIKFMRRIPQDPMINYEFVDSQERNYGWRVRSYQDPVDSVVWGRQNVYDVATKSAGKALDGSYYKDW